MTGTNKLLGLSTALIKIGIEKFSVDTPSKISFSSQYACTKVVYKRHSVYEAEDQAHRIASRH
ncbi:hypothetical protein HJFPF1_11709 [Paramyrothecium foliicola]|nr:hypothetical protein HJFPF1_11709 [Paramyrothecium foliicola]